MWLVSNAPHLNLPNNHRMDPPPNLVFSWQQAASPLAHPFHSPNPRKQ